MSLLFPDSSRLRASTMTSLVAASLLLVSACGSTAVTSTSPTPAKCTVALTAPATPVDAVGGIATVTLTTAPECAWTAEAGASWVTRIEPLSGQGSGSLQVNLSSNPAAVARETDIVVNGVRARIQQQPTPCRYDLSAGTASIGSGGGSGRVEVSSDAACAWTASTVDDWITITSGLANTGTGIVEFTVEPNARNTARTGSLIVAGRTFTVTQGGLVPGCSYDVTPLGHTMTAAGGTATVSVTTGCAWSAVSSVPWITPGASAGTGNGTFTILVASNTGPARNGTIVIGSETVTVAQAGATACVATVNPTSLSAPVGGATGLSVSVSTAAACNWTANSAASWLTVTTATAAGNGTVAINVAANTGSARTGSLTVAGQLVTVAQAGTCTLGVSPPTVTVPAAGASGQTVSVTAGTGCAWTTTSQASWLSVTAGTTGTGNGSVSFNVAANTGSARTGTISVSGQTVTVTQAAAGCSYVVSPLSVSIAAAAGAVPAITVTAPAGCAWTATTSTPWLTVSSGAAGSGNGSVAVTAAANTGGARSGSLSIAGSTVAVDQSAACTYSANVAPLSFRDEGGTATGTVTTGAGCSWTATSDSSWIVLSGAATRTGSQTLTFTIQANPGARRNGTITMAGQTFAIFQDNK